ncbi:MAG: glucokinase [Xanthomonadales bacterium]
MKILAADIGGTNARFARVEIEGLSALEMSEPVVFPTWSDAIGSFDHLLEHYSANRPPGTPDIDQFDALSIAIAGAVSGQRATLPNISWDIDLSVSRPVREGFLLNDFSAQAHGFMDPRVFDRLHCVRGGTGAGPGSIAIVGAGTGLGHAALKAHQGQRIVLTSEAGHATFAFHGARERAIEDKILARTGRRWLSSENMVSGSGAALLHEALTGKAVPPGEALRRDTSESETCRYFSRFYARVCRDFCLAHFPVEALIISGGVAAKNPHLLETPSFLDEFDDGNAFRHLLERIPVYLNQDETIGIKGAAIHAWLQLSGG